MFGSRSSERPGSAHPSVEIVTPCDIEFLPAVLPDAKKGNALPTIMRAPFLACSYKFLMARLRGYLGTGMSVYHQQQRA